MTRNGKIARLPRHIRDELNRRLDNGEQGTHLVEWLNTHDEVKRVLATDFGGRPINEQNLSDWKQGGYYDWQELQESREWVRLVTDEADQVAEDSGLMPLSDRISSMSALLLGKLIRELASQARTDSASRQDLMRALRELTRLRRDDLRVACMHDQFSLNAAKRRNRISAA
jgi:hypothetical protein